MSHQSENSEPDADELPTMSRWAWIGLAVFFVGTAALTVAVVELAGNHRVSAVAALIGAPIAIIGLVLLFVFGRIPHHD